MFASARPPPRPRRLRHRQRRRRATPARRCQHGHPGRIIDLPVKEGQSVTKGQLLLQIDPAIYQAAVDHDKAALAAAKASAVEAHANAFQAESNYNRFSRIKQTNTALLSDQDLENYKTLRDVAVATASAADFQVAQADAQLHNSQSALNKTNVVAPMSGLITRLPVHQGETAIEGTLNKDAATLLTISDMAILDTKIKVDETGRRAHSSRRHRASAAGCFP